MSPTFPNKSLPSPNSQAHLLRPGAEPPTQPALRSWPYTPTPCPRPRPQPRQGPHPAGRALPDEAAPSPTSSWVVLRLLASLPGECTLAVGQPAGRRPQLPLGMQLRPARLPQHMSEVSLGLAQAEWKETPNGIPTHQWGESLPPKTRAI